ncbi:MAG: RluA family pseudouridine synthase [Candidatus Colwellbacteria bacterium]|nr:RluA family pseudouridine synthase [Candidatus Colwellbacteria bacterium]
MEIKVVYEDKNFVAVSKPAGLLVHGTLSSGKSRDEETLVDWLIERFPEIKNVGDDTKIRPGIVHRLDKDTSGIILIPRNQEYFNYLKSLFQRHDIKKTYLALVNGHVLSQEGTISKPIGLKSGTIKHTVNVKGAKMVKPAETEYKVKKYIGNYTLLGVSPKTGRTHQIRVHLASIGHPIVGDKIYGKKEESLKPSRLFLHADSLEFSPEPNKNLKLSVDFPEELQEILKSVT